MGGGTPGDLKGLKNFWDPAGITSKLDAKQLERQRLCELKNGRLVMLGIASVLVANSIPGSIPVPISSPFRLLRGRATAYTRTIVCVAGGVCLRGGSAAATSRE